MSGMSGLRQVFCTAPKAEAAPIAEALLAERLVACVQMFPVASRYWWRGKLESAAEVMLLMKTRAGLMDKLTARIRELHPYEVPEVVAVEIEEGSPEYLAWVREETRQE